MAKLRLSPAARADLADIDDWGAHRFGRKTADTYSRGLRDAFALLRQYPEVGTARAELGKGIRSLVHRQHRLFYRIENDTVLIVRVVHHAMDAKRAMKGAAGR